MPTLHFLNVRQGDCTWIQHADGKNTVVDVCNGRDTVTEGVLTAFLREMIEKAEAVKGLRGNFRQKDYPVNPIDYLKSFGVTSVFRFILTHPDMDHMDGIAQLFQEFSPTNFWDTDNTKEMDDFDESRYSLDDWELYQSLRDGKPTTQPKRLTLLSGATGPYYNQGDNGATGGNGLYVLAPTAQIVSDANTCGDFNDCSYVLLYRVGDKRVVIGGDSHDVSWEHILSTHREDIEGIDLLIAPHHGRKSDRSYDFLDVLQPKLTFFGIARSDHLGYSAWRDRGLEVMTNNQGNCFVVDFTDGRADVHCTNAAFAHAYRREKFGKESFKDEALQSWYVRSI
jgi:competence protein ComEC